MGILTTNEGGIVNLALADGGSLQAFIQPGSLTPGTLTPGTVQPAALQGALFVDPQNSTGNASPAGPGTASAPFDRWSSLVNKWGTIRPILNLTTTVQFLSNSPADGSDPVVWEPVTYGGILPQIRGTRSAANTVQTGVLAGVTPKSRVGAGAQLTVTLAAGLAAGQAIVNTTKGSMAFLSANTAGNTWTVSQPNVLLVPPHNAAAPAQDNTWANGDAYTVFAQTLVDLVYLFPVIADYNAAFTNFLAIYALSVLDTSPGGGIGLGQLTARSQAVSWYEVNINRALYDLAAFPPATIRNGFFNCDFNAPVSVAAPAVWSGQYRFSTIPNVAASFGASSLGSDFVALQNLSLLIGGSYDTIYVAAGKQLQITSGFAGPATGAPVLYGPGGLNVQGSSRFRYPAGAGAAVATFQLTGGLQLNGQGAALNGGPGALPTLTAALSAANLDNVAVFAGNAWAPGGASITNSLA